MKKVFLYFAALTAVAVACRKVEIEPQEEVDPEPEVEMITETITGSRDVSTKVTIDNTSGAFAWTATNDLVAVHVSTGVYVTSAGASTSAKSATFDVTYPAGATRDAFAVFPSTIVAADAANYGQEGHTLDVTLPSSYTLAQVSGETSPCPMIATNDPGSSEWSFKQLCGLLRLTVNGIPPSTKRLEIDFDGKKVCGDFSIASPEPGTSVVSTTTDDSHDIITITKDGTDVTLNDGVWLDGLVVNIPLPTGTYTNITVTAYDALMAGNAVLTKSSAFAYTAKRQKATKRTTSFPVFSVSATKRVIFAPGNLQAKTTDYGANWTWHFAEHQYDYIGATSGNVNIKNQTPVELNIQNGTIDLFGFSTNNTFFGISNSYSTALFEGSFIDWGTNSIDGYSPNYWSTLSEAEWQYVIGEDVDAKSRFFNGEDNSVVNAICTKAFVAGIKGLIIFPDYYSGFTPSGVTWNYNFVSPGKMKHSATQGWGTTISLENWQALEAEGCVFLPVTGFRAGYYGLYFIEGGNAYTDDPTGYYMSSTPTSGDIRTLRFNGKTTSHGFDPNQAVNRGYACAVRLVHEL